jgi:NADH dehydrogenase (ubiquinone) 1 alpha subcomplex subunit 13
MHKAYEADDPTRCSELKREKAWSRIHLVPLIMAEADRDAYRRNVTQLAREKEIMKDVPDWEVSDLRLSCLCYLSDILNVWTFTQAGKSVYNSKRYTPANFIVL